MSDQNIAICPCDPVQTVMLPIICLGLGVDATALQGITGAEGLSREEVAQMVESALEGHPCGLSAEEVEQMIGSALADNRLTREEVEQMIESALQNYPAGELSREEAASMIDEALRSMTGSGATNYSLKEQWTGAYWIDGKKIYQKVIALPSLFSSTAHGIANLGKVVDVFGRFQQGANQFPLPFPNRNGTYNVDLICTSTTVSARASNTGDYGGVSECYVIMRYTCTNR